MILFMIYFFNLKITVPSFLCLANNADTWYTVSTALAELNKKYNFYDTHYRFFMDFDYTYLLSTSAKTIKARGEVYSDIIINIVVDIANVRVLIL